MENSLEEVKDNLAYLPGVLVAISLHKKDLESYDESQWCTCIFSLFYQEIAIWDFL